MKNKKKENETNNILMILASIAIIVAIIGGATFAYWSWESNTAQKTTVDVTVAGGSLTIDGGAVTTIENNTMYPTNDCDGVAALIGSESTVTATNDTATSMTVSLSIDAKITQGTAGFPSVTDRSYLKWAIVDTGDDTVTCGNSLITGNFETVTSSGTFFPIDTGINFSVPAETELTKNYRIYVWLDATYEFTNSGDNVTDPMQNLGISVKWSESSTMTQQPQS